MSFQEAQFDSEIWLPTAALIWFPMFLVANNLNTLV